MNNTTNSQTEMPRPVRWSAWLGILAWFLCGILYMGIRSLWFLTHGGHPPKEPPMCDVAAVGLWMHGTIILLLVKMISWAWKR